MGVALLALLDEPGILGKAAGVKVERDAIALAQRADLATFSMETGWPPPELLVTVSITNGTLPRPSSSSNRSRAATSMLPLKG